MNLENTTPFAAEAYGLDDGKGRNMVLVIVKATHTFTKEGVISLASKQAPIELADEFYGKPGESSIKYASDFCFDIPATDIAMIGHIQAPDPDCTTLMVTLRVGTKEKTIQLFGKRHWRNGMGIHLPSAPEPFEKIPLMYEYAYGGTDTSHDDPKKHDCEQRNPLGVGFRAKKSKLPIKGTALPHIEDPAALIKAPDKKPAPAGFGFINPSWEPRKSFAGTYDEQWQKTMMPQLPDDFNPRFFNAAHPDLVYDGHLGSTEQVCISGLTKEKDITFTLPGIFPRYTINNDQIGGDAAHCVHGDLKISRFIIDIDKETFYIVWTGNTRIDEEFSAIEKISCFLKEEKQKSE